MPGPAPKDPRLRQRRNKAATRALLTTRERPRLRAPRLPEVEMVVEGEDGVRETRVLEWHPMAREFWLRVWASPMVHEFLRADEPALMRLLYMVDRFWKTGDMQAAVEIRHLEKEFGLTPLSRRRLEWSVVQTEEALSSFQETHRVVEVVDAVDVRDVLT